MVTVVARGLLGVAGWARDKSRSAGGLMDFAPEPVLDAFTPPPTRTAPREAVADDNGQTFDDHLEAVNEPVRERPAPQNETKSEAPAPVETKPARADDAADGDETLDVDAALLGGPAPVVAPPMTAPVIVQIAASQPQQQQAPVETGDADVAPVSAPQMAAPEAPAADADVATAAPAAASQSAANAKGADTEVRPSAPAAQPSQTTPQPANVQAQPQQTAPQQAAAQPIAVEELAPAIQQAIAATIAPAPQAVVTPTAQRSGKAAAPTDEAKAAPSAPDGKPEGPQAPNTARPHATANTQGGSNAVAVEVAAPMTTQSSAADNSQISQSNAISTTASQASTHVQHAAAETGAQRSAPAAAQVSREIVRRFNGGNTSFEMRLDPAELGRVEVRMEVSRDHRVTAVITADNPQALTELARHARELEQQLQSAGLHLSENGLSFDLRQGGQGGESEHANNNARANGGEEALSEQQPAPVARPIGYERWRGVRVDMMV